MSTRTNHTFTSGGSECAAWLFRPDPDPSGGTPGPCVVMSHGFSMTRHDGLVPYAQALAGAGASVLVFDHRHLGDSGGEPRQRFRIAEQAEDVRAAIAYARTLDGVDPARIVLWGFSFSGGTAVNVAAADASLAGLILLCPFLDGLARVLNTRPGLVGWIVPKALQDLAGRRVLIPVTAAPGGRAAMTLPGEADGFAAASDTASPWRNEISPGVFATVAFHRPFKKAAQLTCPVWVGLGERDVSVSKRAIERFADRAVDAELHRYDVDHFEPFHGAPPEVIAADQADWLRRTFSGE